MPANIYKLTPFLVVPGKMLVYSSDSEICLISSYFFCKIMGMKRDRFQIATCDKSKGGSIILYLELILMKSFCSVQGFLGRVNLLELANTKNIPSPYKGFQDGGRGEPCVHPLN
jgi:hypothetical protein